MQDLSPEFSKILYWQVEVVEQMETAKAAMPHDSIYVRNQGKWCWWLLPSSWAPAHGSGVSIHELFSTSQDTWISPVCQVSLEEPFSRIDLFHFYNISALGQVMKQHVVITSNNTGDVPVQMSFIHSTDDYWALTMYLARARCRRYAIKQDTVTNLEFINILRFLRETKR